MSDGKGGKTRTGEAALAPGFTPGRKDVAPLVAELKDCDDARAKAVTKALLKAPEPTTDAVLVALDVAVRPQRGRLVALLGQILETEPSPTAAERIAGALRALASDADLKTQLNAVTALARLPGEATEALLLDLWRGAARPELRRALLRSLGKAGGAAAARLLMDVAAPTDPEELRLLEQARLILARTTTRASAGTTKTDVSLGGERVDLNCRAGLAPILVDEVGAGAAPEVIGDDRVRIRHRGTLADLLRYRVMDHVSFPLPVDRGADLAEVAVHAFASGEAARIFGLLADGAPRYRIDWPAASTAQVWALAKALSAAHPDRVNDPTESQWELRIEATPRGPSVALVPKRLPDERFAYRVGTVPASSHPTIAAALARLAGVRADDVVWDPFAGAGAELIERARLGAFKDMLGTDLSADATAAATANVSAAGVLGIRLETKSCFDVTDLAPTLIITNPPMGRRVARGELKPLLDAFVAHVGRVLAPNGRLVWISPLPERTAEALAKAGLRLSYHRTVDMGGFPAELQLAERRASPR